MRTKSLQRAAALLLCVFLCLGTAFSLMGAAYAADAEPPASGITIEIMLPSDWTSTSAAAKVCITDETGGGFASAEARIDRDGSWSDLGLEQRQNRYYGEVNMTGNCTVYVRVTGRDGEVYENSRYMECFDRTPPTLRASIVGNVLRAEATDDLSGVFQITVAGRCYTNLTGGTLDVPLSDLGTSEQIAVRAADTAGNYSQTVQVKNPNYQPPATSEVPVDVVQPPAAVTPAVTTPVKQPSTPVDTETTAPIGIVQAKEDKDDEDGDQPEAKPLTPDGQGSVVDNVTDADSKEFYTFTTPNENVFYLVIDKQRESENVYFLNAVTESDLAALAEKDKEPEGGGVTAIPDPEPLCSCKNKCAPGEVNTDCPVCVLTLADCTGMVHTADPDPKPETPEKGINGTMILVLLAALAVGAAGYYLKIYKPKHDLDDAEDFEDLTGEDEETINEDDDEPTPQRDPYGEPDEPDYPEDYGYDESEDEA